MNKDKKGFTLAEAKKNISLATFRGKGIKGEGASKKAAFTLAEVLIVLLVLGIVAMIVIPPVMKKHQEMIARMKIKKSMTIYDGAIMRMTIENDLKTGTALKSWANEGGNCDNPAMYFKTNSRTGCVFKTADGVWWDITDIMNPIIALSEKDLEKAKNEGTDGVRSFKLVTSYDANLGTFRIDDITFERNRLEGELAQAISEETKAEIQEKYDELLKLLGFVNGNKNTPQIKYLLSMMCTISSSESKSCEKYDYDGKGNKTAYYYDCDGSGNNCWSSKKYEYDSKGNQTAHYFDCDGSGNNCSSSTKFEYDGKGNKTAEYYCNGSGNNCSYSYKYEYDSKGNQTSDYYCDGSGNNCSKSQKYEYDGKGNKTAEYFDCDGSGNNCSGSSKYEYDGKGNQTAWYLNCDGSGNNCSKSSKYDYDGKGNQTVAYFGCNTSGNNCSFSNKYEYDSKGNKTAEYFCDGSGNNCSRSQKYEYDSKGNKTADYYNCDGSGNNCSSSYKYENSYIKMK